MKKTWFFVLAFMICLNIGSIAILATPEGVVHSKITSSYKKDHGILSLVNGDLLHDGSSIKVVKLKTAEGIVLEFYNEALNGSRSKINRVIMPDTEDGFFNYHGQAIQLAVVDLDGDGKMELIAPTFDEKLFARLNPYHYDTEQKAFVPFYLR